MAGPEGIVAPFMGAWIETTQSSRTWALYSVAPFMGAWIETDWQEGIDFNDIVAPFMGAWIETFATWKL